MTLTLHLAERAQRIALVFGLRVQVSGQGLRFCSVNPQVQFFFGPVSEAVA